MRKRERDIEREWERKSESECEWGIDRYANHYHFRISFIVLANAKIQLKNRRVLYRTEVQQLIPVRGHSSRMTRWQADSTIIGSLLRDLRLRCNNCLHYISLIHSFLPWINKASSNIKNRSSFRLGVHRLVKTRQDEVVTFSHSTSHSCLWSNTHRLVIALVCAAS